MGNTLSSTDSWNACLDAYFCESHSRSSAVTWSTSPLQNSPLKVTTTSLPSGRAGEGYDSPRSTAAGGVPFTTTFVDGTTVPYRWSISNPPTGLDISYYTGEVYGRPTQEGQYYPKITVTDSTGNSAPATLQLLIQPPTNKSRFTPQQKAYYAQIAEYWLQKSAFWQQQLELCKAATALEPKNDPRAASCNLDSILMVLNVCDRPLLQFPRGRSSRSELHDNYAAHPTKLRHSKC